MEKVTYLTIKAISEGRYKEKGSKFIGFALPMNDPNELKELLEHVRKLHHSARHHCFAYAVGPNQEIERTADDGEPSNSAGKPILGQLHATHVTNCLIVVVRYFGGTKLGVGGLIHAYRAAAREALDNAKIIEREVRAYLTLNFEYDIMTPVMNKIKALESSLDVKIEEQKFENSCYMKLSTGKNNKDSVIELLEKISNLEVEFHSSY